jgi:hypothetical protein
MTRRKTPTKSTLPKKKLKRTQALLLQALQQQPCNSNIYTLCSSPTTHDQVLQHLLCFEKTTIPPGTGHLIPGAGQFYFRSCLPHREQNSSGTQFWWVPLKGINHGCSGYFDRCGRLGPGVDFASVVNLISRIGTDLDTHAETLP